MEKHLDFVVKYASSKNIDPNPIIETIYRYNALFDSCNSYTLYYFNKFHMKVFLYLIDKYPVLPTDNELNMLFFMVIVHIVEDYLVISTNILGDGMCKRFLEINDKMFSYLFKVNSNNGIIDEFWKTI